MTVDRDDRDAELLRLAVRLALRGHGLVEPNPMVGCVVLDASGRIAGLGHHRRVGGPHAEIEALAAAGERARGGSLLVTLEPCNHQGRTGPCTEAILDSGIARMVYGEPDPNPVAGGGARRLADAGLEVVKRDDLEEVRRLNRPFMHRIRTGRPWVVAKWAQTLDGKITGGAGDGRWISSGLSRRLVHRERGCCDAILTGIGTVLVDDPLLNVRDVPSRRTPLRVVVDARLQIPLSSKLVATAASQPTLVVCDSEVRRSDADLAAQLEARGVTLLDLPATGGELPLRTLCERLSADFGVARVLVEAGARLLGRLFRNGLVDEAWVFVAPRVAGGDSGMPAVAGATEGGLVESLGLRLESIRRRGDDLVLGYGVPSDAGTRP
ncbi:MAG: bifunctional diaminohydroxyphosphoribosylaminopyrimidine deaminase/5-amino-6-(5-phosphoribosylamino)uracil reductase RibD [Planctomycetota bacterium]|jgi:diaminohydroxyphosphoribosylaminopyrimidine deaminase/5-amino-6-(5-phosphoribosylamino)uracil reductase